MDEPELTPFEQMQDWMQTVFHNAIEALNDGDPCPSVLIESPDGTLRRSALVLKGQDSFEDVAKSPLAAVARKFVASQPEAWLYAFYWFGSLITEDGRKVRAICAEIGSRAYPRAMQLAQSYARRKSGQLEYRLGSHSRILGDTISAWIDPGAGPATADDVEIKIEHSRPGPDLMQLIETAVDYTFDLRSQTDLQKPLLFHATYDGHHTCLVVETEDSEDTYDDLIDIGFEVARESDDWLRYCMVYWEETKERGRRVGTLTLVAEERDQAAFEYSVQYVLNARGALVEQKETVFTGLVEPLWSDTNE